MSAEFNALECAEEMEALPLSLLLSSDAHDSPWTERPETTSNKGETGRWGRRLARSPET